MLRQAQHEVVKRPQPLTGIPHWRPSLAREGNADLVALARRLGDAFRKLPGQRLAVKLLQLENRDAARDQHLAKLRHVGNFAAVGNRKRFLQEFQISQRILALILI